MRRSENASAPVVMLIDDNVELVRMSAALLEAWGYQVVFAYSSQTAIALAAAEVPSVFVIDIGLLGMDGYALGALLKKEHPEAYFIGNGAWERDCRRETETEFTFDHFVCKPIGFLGLKMLLSTITEGKQLPKRL